jgi:hypothetical protein
MSRSLIRILPALAFWESRSPSLAQTPALTVSGAKTADYLNNAGATGICAATSPTMFCKS